MAPGSDEGFVRNCTSRFSSNPFIAVLAGKLWLTRSVSGKNSDLLQ